MVKKTGYLRKKDEALGGRGINWGRCRTQKEKEQRKKKKSLGEGKVGAWTTHLATEKKRNRKRAK